METQLAPETTSRQRFVLFSLVGANLVPLLGVVFLGWDVGDIMVLFWAESAIVALYAIIRMVVVGKLLALFAVPFFCFHFGIFMVAHLAFILVFFVGTSPFLDGPVTTRVVVDIFGRVWIALLALLVSHGLSFWHYFVKKNEPRRDLGREMGAPYGRIVIMHLTIIFGGIPTLLLGSPVFAVALLVVLKIIADVTRHRVAHKQIMLRRWFRRASAT